MSSDPFSPPESDVTGPASSRARLVGAPRLTIEPPKAGKWRAHFHDDAIECVRLQDDHAVVVKRGDIPDIATLLFMPNGVVSLNIRKPETIPIVVPEHQRYQLREWLDPILADLIQRPAKKALARNILFTVFCFVMLVLDRTTFWVLLAAWNFVSIASGFLPPTRYLFLGAAAYSTAVGAYFVYWYTQNDAWWMLIFVGLLVFGIIGNIHRFRFYGEKPAPSLSPSD